MKIRIDDIVIHKRIRDDIGDMSELRDSMRERGLINPIVINQDNELLAGYRRLMAARELGWKDINCRVLHTTSKIDKLNIEKDENIGRKDFTPGEIQKYNEISEYLQAKGLHKIKLWLKKIFKIIRDWLNAIFSRK
ncbi:MAG TPA: ParB N-terminal domain-containing protein [Spirochaetota bacterium]|nr:ParB N-terminal domain-containing protein [Spirochaetota bacterium]HPI89158.1 ParB N-terminal domain-containing protein [Spirochaetota bacterium]HPR46847.1 ParB N-terminal domain-containing protein [Spirochaetota bacterium]